MARGRDHSGLCFPARAGVIEDPRGGASLGNRFLRQKRFGSATNSDGENCQTANRVLLVLSLSNRSTEREPAPVIASHRNNARYSVSSKPSSVSSESTISH